MNAALALTATGALLLALQGRAPAETSAPIPLPVPAVETAQPQVAWLTVPDIKGSYTIPHIQSSRRLEFALQFGAQSPHQARVRLLLGPKLVRELTASPAEPLVRFAGLHPGEYSVEVIGVNGAGVAVAHATTTRLGVGTVIGAIGDSITEGYQGHGFHRDNLDLHAADFPAEAVSRDGRNFPQYSPTTAWHRPDVNCFQSWMTLLNDRLSERWAQPVFIANEGYGGITSGAYLNTMRTDAGWQARMRLLRPQVWLIHLGVNDERAKVSAADYAANMDAIVDILQHTYSAKPERILICRPCYDYAEGAVDILRGYIAAQDELIARRGLSRGPDFFAAYAVDKARWYGDDPVHPNIEGMDYMARLWFEALVAALHRGVGR